MRLVRGWVLRLLVLGICLALLTRTVASLGPRRVLDAATRANPFWLVLSVLAVAARYLVWGAKWTGMLRRQGTIAFAPSFRALMAGVFVNLTTPTAKLAGGFVRAGLIHRRTGWGLVTSYGWALADQVTNALGNVWLGGGLLLIASIGLPAHADRALFVGLGLSALVGVTGMVALRGWAWNQIRRPAAARWAARLTPSRFRGKEPGGSSVSWLEAVARPVLHVGRTSWVAPLDLGLAALSFGFLCLSNAFALQAIGLEAPVFQTAAALVLAGFAGSFVGTVGGIGATELALIGLYDRMHMPPEAAAAGALLHRSAYYLVSATLGGAAVLWEGRTAEVARE